MRKALILGLLATLSFDIFAQVTDSEVEIKTLSSPSADLLPDLDMSWAEDMALTLETETMTVKDDSNDINGTATFFLLEPGYRINRQFNVSVGAQYNVRQMNEDADIKSSARERENSDHLENVFLKLNYRAFRFSENGALDLRLQARAYNDQNDIFKTRYGSDGNYQFRAYFGRPLYGRFSINRFTSYLRYKKYFLNSSSSDFSRDNELRARISPTYTPLDGLDLSLQFTYNHINLRGNTSAAGRNYSEELDVGPSIRYQQGRYAVLFWSDMQMLQTDENGALAENEKAGAEVTYALNFAAFL